MELTVNQDKPQSSKANFTPLPMFEVLDPSDSVSQDAQTEEKDDSLGSKDHHIASDELAKAFTKAFGLEAHEKLYSQFLLCPYPHETPLCYLLVPVCLPIGRF